MFQEINHMDLLYILRSDTESFFVHLTPAMFFKWHLVIFFVIITDIWWDISNYYIGSRMIYHPFNISEKLHWQNLLEMLDITPVHSEEQHQSHWSKYEPPPLPFLHLDTSPKLSHSLLHAVNKTYVLDTTIGIKLVALLE